MLLLLIRFQRILINDPFGDPGVYVDFN